MSYKFKKGDKVKASKYLDGTDFESLRGVVVGTYDILENELLYILRITKQPKVKMPLGEHPEVYSYYERELELITPRKAKVYKRKESK